MFVVGGGRFGVGSEQIGLGVWFGFGRGWDAARVGVFKGRF